MNKATFASLLLAQPVPAPLDLAAYASIGCLHTISFLVNPLKFNLLSALFSLGLRIVRKLDNQVLTYSTPPGQARPCAYGIATGKCTIAFEA